VKQGREGDELAQVISKLRRLEKWKETYIERILEASEYDGRFYTGMNQFNPISGRFSGDAQQFPKDKITDENGEEIFHPRRAFTTSSDYMYFIDFSQIELRVQAHSSVSTTSVDSSSMT
jgi:DNA polymerase I-like protein with 3'-5' exonuclease and polymerase domains